MRVLPTGDTDLTLFLLIASLQPLLGAELGRVPGLPEQERGGAGEPDQDAARDARTRRLRRSTRQPLSQVIFEPYFHFGRLFAV